MKDCNHLASLKDKKKHITLAQTKVPLQYSYTNGFEYPIGGLLTLEMFHKDLPHSDAQ